MNLTADEQGKRSTSRMAFWIVLIWTLAALTLVGFKVFVLPAAGYALLGTIFTFVTVWAAGPRIAQYLGPQIGRVVESISKAKADPRLPDIRKDDESGD